MITTILILLPIAGAVAIWIVPWSSQRAAGGFALLVALGELALWVGTALNFDFEATGLQNEADVSWFSDLDVAYKVGFYDYSLWLVGLTVVVTAAAVGYGLWTGRDRLGVYLSLLLFLEGATIGVFTSQDLILFYVFWEAMLIPLYVLIGVWGGPGRLGATYKFVAYTMAGSLLMLVAIVAAGLGAGTFDIAELAGQGTSTWIFLGFAVAFAVKAPLWPFHGWLPDAYREAPAEVAALLSGVISKTAAYGFLAIAVPLYPGPAEDWRTVILVLASIGLVYGSLLAFRSPDVRGVIAYSNVAWANSSSASAASSSASTRYAWAMSTATDATACGASSSRQGRAASRSWVRAESMSPASSATSPRAWASSARITGVSYVVRIVAISSAAARAGSGSPAATMICTQAGRRRRRSKGSLASTSARRIPVTADSMRPSESRRRASPGWSSVPRSLARR